MKYRTICKIDGLIASYAIIACYCYVISLCHCVIKMKDYYDPLK
jgi:hypothetical protein